MMKWASPHSRDYSQALLYPYCAMNRNVKNGSTTGVAGSRANTCEVHCIVVGWCLPCSSLFLPWNMPWTLYEYINQHSTIHNIPLGFILQSSWVSPASHSTRALRHQTSFQSSDPEGSTKKGCKGKLIGRNLEGAGQISTPLSQKRSIPYNSTLPSRLNLGGVQILCLMSSMHPRSRPPDSPTVARG